MKIVSFVLLVLWIAVKAIQGLNSLEQQIPRSNRSEQGCSRKERGADTLSAFFE